MILFSIQWGETEFCEFTKHIFNFVIEGVWCAVLIDEGHIKIPFSKYVPIVDNMSNVDEINFSNLLAIGICGPLVRISISLLVLVRARVLSFSNPIEVIVGVAINLASPLQWNANFHAQTVPQTFRESTACRLQKHFGGQFEKVFMENFKNHGGVAQKGSGRLQEPFTGGTKSLKDTPRRPRRSQNMVKGLPKWASDSVTG